MVQDKKTFGNFTDLALISHFASVMYKRVSTAFHVRFITEQIYHWSRFYQNLLNSVDISSYITASKTLNAITSSYPRATTVCRHVFQHFSKSKKSSCSLGVVVGGGVWHQTPPPPPPLNFNLTLSPKSQVVV